MMVRAAVLEAFGEDLVVQEVDLAPPGPGEVLVRLVACGVCHTDLYTASGVDPSGYVPTVLGHEGAGVVERIGPGVTLVKPGDHVLTLFEPECGACVHCRDERTNLCLAHREPQDRGVFADGTTRLSRGGKPLRHFMGTSAFAEYTVMPEHALAVLDRAAPLDEACIFACGYTSGLGAALNTAAVAEGSTCVVFGTGLVGLGAIAGCRLRGAERIIAVDLSAERLEVARQQGATETWIADEHVVERVRETTGGFGADYTFEATGIGSVMGQAVEAARMGWGLAVICGAAGKGDLLRVVPRLLITGRRVTGSEFGNVKGRTGVPALVRRWLDGELDVAPLVNHRLRLDEVNRAFDLLRDRSGVRSVILYD